MQANGLPCWARIAPMPSPEASVWMTNGALKFGIASVEVDVMAFFSLSKAASAVVFHSNFSFMSRLVNGFAMISYSFTN